jgi:hypothetical protein
VRGEDDIGESRQDETEPPLEDEGFEVPCSLAETL